MALNFWPFNRKRTDQALPEEVQEFYESGRKQQTGMAWLLALGTLVVTVLLAIVLFYGGRWVYEKIAGDDQPEQPTSQVDDQSQNSGQQPETPADDQQASSTNTSTPSPASTTPSTTTSTTPNSGPSGPEIPDTGPGPGGLQ